MLQTQSYYYCIRIYLSKNKQIGKKKFQKAKSFPFRTLWMIILCILVIPKSKNRYFFVYLTFRPFGIEFGFQIFVVILVTLSKLAPHTEDGLKMLFYSTFYCDCTVLIRFLDFLLSQNDKNNQTNGKNVHMLNRRPYTAYVILQKRCFFFFIFEYSPLFCESSSSNEKKSQQNDYLLTKCAYVFEVASRKNFTFDAK